MQEREKEQESQRKRERERGGKTGNFKKCRISNFNYKI